MNAGRFSIMPDETSEETETQDETPSEDVDAGTDEEEAETEEEESQEEIDYSVGAILNRVESGQPLEGDAERLRELNRNWTQNQMRAADLNKQEQRINEVRQELLQRIDALESETGEEETPKDDLSDIDPTDVERLERVLEARGYVKRDYLTEQEEARKAKERERTQAQINAEHNKAAIELFGEDFGTLNPDGTVEINPELQKELGPTFDRMYNQQATTMKDLFIVHNFEKLMDAQFQKGKKEGLNTRTSQNGEQVRRVKKATVAQRLSGGVPDDSLYNREDPKQRGDLRGFFQRARDSLT